LWQPQPSQGVVFAQPPVNLVILREPASAKYLP
jgi:hypothetical protein